MKDHIVSPRYAKVLFNLDSKKGDPVKHLEDFKLLLTLLKQNSNLYRFLKAPQVAFKEKMKAFREIVKENFDQTFINFCLYLIKKRRLVHLKSIAKEYQHLVNRDLERWEAEIVTAVPIDAESNAKLINKLEKQFNKKVHLKNRIDPTIIGGAILVTSNEMLDWSVAGRLKKLKENLISIQV